jgi:hypothetical protein
MRHGQVACCVCRDKTSVVMAEMMGERKGKEAFRSTYARWQEKRPEYQKISNKQPAGQTRLS